MATPPLADTARYDLLRSDGADGADDQVADNEAAHGTSTTTTQASHEA